MGRLAHYNEVLAEDVVNNAILSHLVDNLAEKNKFFKKNAAFVLRNVAKHSAKLADCVV